jgi:hypothetical protein
MAETMSFALVRALILTLTLIPCWLPIGSKGVLRNRIAPSGGEAENRGQLVGRLARPKTTIVIAA